MSIVQKGKSLVDLIYPKSCYACNTRLVVGEEVLCIKCELDLIPSPEKLEVTDKSVLNRLHGRVPVLKVFNLMSYKKGSRVQNLIYEFKYNGHTQIGRYLGRVTGRILRNKEDFDVVIPLPLHVKKLRSRGFNQSEVFAKAFSEQSDIAYMEKALIRTKNVDTQTKKSRMDRWENVEKIFTVSDRNLFRGQNVLLVDDIYTTGSTLESAGREILSNGAKSLSILTIAIAEN